MGHSRHRHRICREPAAGRPAPRRQPSGQLYRGPGARAAGPKHHYTFEIYALDATIEVPHGANEQETRTAVFAAMQAAEQAGWTHELGVDSGIALVVGTSKGPVEEWLARPSRAAVMGAGDRLVPADVIVVQRNAEVPVDEVSDPLAGPQLDWAKHREREIAWSAAGSLAAWTSALSA